MKAVRPSQQRSRTSRLSRFLLATALLSAGSALAAPTPSRVSVTIVSDGTASFTNNTFDGTNYPGQDGSATNNVVRTNDTMTYAWQYNLQAGNTNVTVVSTLPKVNGQIYETWQAIPAQCDQTLSSMSADKQTITCVIAGTVPGNQVRNITPIANVLGNVPNGTVLPAPTTTIYSQENPTPLASDIDPNKPNNSVTVTATPRYDLGKTPPTCTPDNTGVIGDCTNTYAIRNVPGKDGTTPGTLIGFPIIISASYGSNIDKSLNNNLTAADMIKGLSPLNSPITFQDDLSNIPGAVIYNEKGDWTNPLAGTAGGCVGYGTLRVGGVNPNVNGTCTVSTTGFVATISVNNMVLNTLNDNNSSRLITDTDSTGKQVINTRLDEFERVLLVWVPNTTSGNYLNTYTGFKPVSSVDGQANVQPSTNLKKGGLDSTGTVNDSDGVSLTPPATAMAGLAGKSFSTGIGGIDKRTGNARGSVTTGATGTSQVRIENDSSGSNNWTGIIMCDKFDNTTFQVNPDANGIEVTGLDSAAVLTTNMANITNAYTPGGTKYYMVQYGIGGVDGNPAGWTRDANNHSLDQATATCADNQSTGGVWYTDLNAVPGKAAAVTKVRVLFNYPLYSSINSYYGSTLWDAYFKWKVVATPSAPELMDNWATVTSKSFTTDNNPFGTGSAIVTDSTGAVWSSYNATGNYTTPYVSNMGDEAWIVAAKASIKKSIPKGVRSNGNVLTPADGQTLDGNAVATFQLTPALTLANATSNAAYPVTVVDTLPANLSYVTGSASITPDSVVTNSDKTTTITWTIQNVVPNSTIAPITFQGLVDGTTPNGTTLTNNSYISTPADTPSQNPTVRAIAGSPYTASAYFTVSNPPGVYPTKTVLTPYVAPQGTAQYQLSWYLLGSGTTGNPQIIDILPFVGDAAGNNALNQNARSTASSSATTNNPVGLASVPTTPTNDPSMVFYYTKANPTTINGDPNDATNALTAGAPISSGATVWCVYASLGQPGCPTSLKDVTAVRGVSTLTPLVAGTQYSTTITVNTSTTAHDGDLYTNSMTLRSDGLTYLAHSSNVTAQVQLFTISGTVFNDKTNQDGIKDSGDNGIGGVTLTLGGYSFGPDGQDNGGTGNDIPVAQNVTVTTDANGDYTFSNLGPGKYTVTETQPSAYTTTKNTVGSAGGSLSGDIISNIVLNRDATFSAATGYNFGEYQNFVKPNLHKWVDNCGAADDLSKCPAARTIVDSDSANSTALPGDILRYTLILDNRANAAALPSTFISDDVPQHTTFLGASADVIATPAAAGGPLISTDPVNLSATPATLPATWANCTGASSTAVTCTASGATHINIGWNTNGDVSIDNTDSIPANSQLRITFWVKVN